MRIVAPGMLLALALSLPSLPAAADVQVRIKKSTQTMQVYVNGQLRDEWPVSTGRGGYGTPGGSFRPQRLEKRWYSTQYRGASMHNAIFFHGGYAIHATTEVGRLGRPASHGCIRLAPRHAAELYSLVRANAGRTRITITH